jgi:2'-5' RNA ligase
MEMYFIAQVLPAALNEKILALKEFMLEHYECRIGLKSPAHITLIAPFWEDSEKENNLIADLDHISSQHFSFFINTINFAAFKPRTLFVDVMGNDKLNALKSSVERHLTEGKKYNIKAEGRPFKPHITIATRDLYKKSFSEAWSYFENKRFEEQWKADSVSLLRHNKKNWDVIHTSQFSISSEQAIQSH